MVIRNRHPLKHQEAAPILQHITETMGCEVTVERLIEVADIDGDQMLIIDGSIDIFYVEGEPFLTLPGIHRHGPTKRYVSVDQGAVKFVLNGAHVMAPGITDAHPAIQEDDLVWVRNPQDTGIAMGRALVDAAEMIEEDRGKAVENLHYLGDELWERNEALTS